MKNLNGRLVNLANGPDQSSHQPFKFHIPHHHFWRVTAEVLFQKIGRPSVVSGKAMILIKQATAYGHLFGKNVEGWPVGQPSSIFFVEIQTQIQVQNQKCGNRKLSSSFF